MTEVDLFARGSAEVVLADPVTRTQLVQYAGASGDFNPLHTDEPYATATGRPSVLAHGMLTMGLTGTALQRLLPPATQVRRFSSRFRAQVWPGDVLVACFTVESSDPATDGDADALSAIRFEIRNHTGDVVLDGQALVDIQTDVDTRPNRC